MKTALVIDDNEGIRRLLSEVIASEGYVVQTAASGPQALTIINECVPSIVLLDSKMPGMNGLEVLAEIRKTHRSVPVLLITAYHEKLDIHDALNSGLIQHLLEKPFSIFHLIDVLRTFDSDLERSCVVKEA